MGPSARMQLGFHFQQQFLNLALRLGSQYYVALPSSRRATSRPAAKDSILEAWQHGTAQWGNATYCEPSLAYCYFHFMQLRAAFEHAVMYHNTIEGCPLFHGLHMCTITL